MKIVIAGGTGHLGQLLLAVFRARGYDCAVLSRNLDVRWDGRHIGPWLHELNGADAVINLAGHTAACRHSAANREAILRSRLHTTRALGRAMEYVRTRPRVWVQMSSASIYAHRLEGDNDEATGWLGNDGMASIAHQVEDAQLEAYLPLTRKVALRTAPVMDPACGAFRRLLARARLGLGGAVGGGRQLISWIHHVDFVRAVEVVLAREDLTGAVNVAAPSPVPQRELMAELRNAFGIRFALPLPRALLEAGAWLARRHTDLELKSSRVVPGRLLATGFRFYVPTWRAAVRALATELDGAEGCGSMQSWPPRSVSSSLRERAPSGR